MVPHAKTTIEGPASREQIVLILMLVTSPVSGIAWEEMYAGIILADRGKGKAADQKLSKKSGSSSQMQQTKWNEATEEMLEWRRIMREANIRSKKAEFETTKAEANRLFKIGDYSQAAAMYLTIHQVYGPNPIILSNLTAAALKLNNYNQAEFMASTALRYDPGNIKARYRRAMARKAQKRYYAAKADLAVVLLKDRNFMDGWKEWDFIEEKLEERKRAGTPIEKDPPDPDPFGGEDPMFPPHDKPGQPLPEPDSDSEDCRNKRGGRPCRAYNHEGCKSTAKACKWSHSTDDRSVRDHLGKNVCTLHLICLCHTGDKCPFSHDKRFLGPGWWDKQNLLKHARDALSQPGVTVHHLVLMNTMIKGYSAHMKEDFDAEELFKTIPKAIKYAADRNTAAGCPGPVPAWGF